MAGMPPFSISPHTQSYRPSISGWRRMSVWKVKRMPSMPGCFFQPASASRAPGASGSKRPMMASRWGWLVAASMAISLRSPSHDGGTITTRSTPALSISPKSSSLPSGSRCGACRAGQGRSGVLAAQIWTCASQIIMAVSVSPAVEVGRNESVVVQLGIGGVEPVYALALARAQPFAWIEAFDRRHQPLPPQDLVAARNAAGKVVVDVEHHRVAIGDKAIERQHLRWNGAGRHRKFQSLKHLDRATRPHAPMTEQAALK